MRCETCDRPNAKAWSDCKRICEHCLDLIRYKRKSDGLMRKYKRKMCKAQDVHLKQS